MTLTRTIKLYALPHEATRLPFRVFGPKAPDDFSAFPNVGHDLRPRSLGKQRRPLLERG